MHISWTRLLAELMPQPMQVTCHTSLCKFIKLAGGAAIAAALAVMREGAPPLRLGLYWLQVTSPFVLFPNRMQKQAINLPVQPTRLETRVENRVYLISKRWGGARKVLLDQHTKKLIHDLM